MKTTNDKPEVQPSRIINTYDQLRVAETSGLPNVAVMTHFSAGARETYRNGWVVIVPGSDVSEGQSQHWSETVNSKVTKGRIFHRWDYKSAGDWRAQHKAAFAAAIEWCRERFPVTEWKRNRFGDYVDARVNKMFPLEKQARTKAAR